MGGRRCPVWFRLKNPLGYLFNPTGFYCKHSGLHGCRGAMLGLEGALCRFLTWRIHSETGRNLPVPRSVFARGTLGTLVQPWCDRMVPNPCRNLAVIACYQAGNLNMVQLPRARTGTYKSSSPFQHHLPVTLQLLSNRYPDEFRTTVFCRVFVIPNPPDSYHAIHFSHNINRNAHDKAGDWLTVKSSAKTHSGTPS